MHFVNSNINSIQYELTLTSEDYEKLETIHKIATMLYPDIQTYGIQNFCKHGVNISLDPCEEKHD
tara:strand:+ start:306 stop:500 length:195 start_codon:yes stop_codon:yes gene_type:complete